ncbi:MAG: 50S ribosomal protein L24 [Candidatus Brocadiia bacterium]
MVIRKNDSIVLLKDITSCSNAEGTPVSEKGERTRVLMAMPETNKVVLQNANYRWRHVRPGPDNPRGGRVQQEAPVDASNVALFCDKCHRGTRVRLERREGRKVRVCVRCGTVIPVVL